MAIISNINGIFNYLPKSQVFNNIRDYLINSLDICSLEYKRINNLPLGSFEKVELFDDIFAIEQTFQTKNRRKCFFESHQKFVDIQMVISGIEQMELIDISNLKIKEPYNSDTDFIIYNLTNKSSKIVLQSADIVIFFPNDGHMGIPKFKKKCIVFKTVIKVPVKYFKGFNV